MRSAGEGAGRARLDDAFASQLQFSLMAALQGGADLEFRTLRRILECEWRPLSGAIAELESWGYVIPRRMSFGEAPGTWVRMSVRGREAFVDHLAALREIAEGEAESV